MSTVAEFTIPASSFPPHGLFEQLPGATVELETVVPLGDGVVPYMWISDANRAAIESVLARQPAVTTFEIVDSISDQHLVRANWPHQDGILQCLTEAGVTLLSATGNKTEWLFEVRAEDRVNLTGFQTLCRDKEIPITVRTIQTTDASEIATEFGLTPAQLEALRLAYDRGYFAEPRRATLEEIAASMDISRQALAARLRRGYRNLIAHTICRPEP